MHDAVLRLIWSRAKSRCEYCLMPQGSDELPFQTEHIIARKHGGGDEESNLALACMACNNHKGPNIAGLDPFGGVLTRLFNPRTDQWEEHFSWNGAELIGLTPIGRTTVAVLSINLPYRVSVRSSLLDEGVVFVR